jgi:hypothetical protein
MIILSSLLSSCKGTFSENRQDLHAGVSTVSGAMALAASAGRRPALQVNAVIPEAARDLRLNTGQAYFFCSESGASELAELSAFEEIISEYPQSRYFYDKLALDARQIYNALLYAFINRYDTVCFSYDGNTTEDIARIRAFLACDSPLLEHNRGVQVFKATSSLGGESQSYWCVKSTDTGADDLDKKRLAYERAQEIIAALPVGEGEYARAKRLYAYVVKNTAYVRSSEYLAAANGLYDALVAGRANCDGFSEAVALLFSLAGIDCVSVMGESADGGSAHAWNLAKIDGEWYALDATYESGYSKLPALGDRLFFFATSGAREDGISLNPLIRDFAPACPADFEPGADAMLDGDYAQIAALYARNMRQGKNLLVLRDERIGEAGYSLSVELGHIARAAGGSVHMGGVLIAERKLLAVYPIN